MEIRQERLHIKKAENYRRFISVFDSYSFYSVLEYRKIGKKIPRMYFVSSKYGSE